MKTIVYRLSILSIALFAASRVVVYTVQGAGAPKYTAINLGTFGGATGEARAINSKGQVVGDAAFAGPVRHAFLWENDVKHDLGTLGGDVSMAFGINDRGQVVGNSSLEGWGTRHACLWDQGRAIDLNPPGATASEAVAINKHGVAAGDYSGADGPHLCIWRNGVATNLNIPAVMGGAATAINDRGQVTGFYVTQTFDWCGFLWEDGAYVNVGACVPNAGFASATGINNHGQVVSGRQGDTPSFLWDRGRVINLPLFPWGINDHGAIAGAVFLPAAGRYHPALWQDGALTDLGDGLGFGGLARAVNDHGEAVGFAWAAADERQGQTPFLWTPR